MKLPIKIRKKINKLVTEYNETGAISLNIIGSGSFREVYALNTNYVLKLERATYPRGTNLANKSEYRTFKRHPNNKAKCILVPGTDGELLIMERLKKIRYDMLDFNAGEYIPLWVYNCKDRVQCGYTKEGKLVRFDYQGSHSLGGR